MLQIISDYLVYDLFSLSPNSVLGKSLNFFIYDTVKIILLLFTMISVIGLIRTYLPKSKIKKILTGKKQGIGNLIASSLGAITPFCSCSSIPMFIGSLEAGIPLGINFSFLITSPLVNEYLVVLMFGFFGWKITLAYVLSGILIGTFAGIFLGNLDLEKYLSKDVFNKKNFIKERKMTNLKERVIFGINEAVSIIKKLWIWITAAIAIGAVIHNYIPAEAIQSLVDKGGIFTVPLAVILGVPMYGGCAAILPIAAVLFEKGLPLGTALAFMMGIAALSLPEAIILRRVMKLKLIGIFFLIVTISIIFTGYLFNVLEAFLV